MGNLWQIIYNRYTCERCNKSAVLGHHPTLGPSYSNICPFCQKPLDIQKVAYEDEIKADSKNPLSRAEFGVVENDLSKLLQNRD